LYLLKWKKSENGKPKGGKILDRDETISVLEWIKGSYSDFYIDPSVAADRWLSSLERYDRETVMSTLHTMSAQTDALPTPLSVKAGCERELQEAEQRRAFRARERHADRVKDSFENIPGDTRLQKIRFVCSQRAAEHWIGGDKSDFFNDVLHLARLSGIEHEGVDYNEVRESDGSFAGPIMGMAGQA
jgi:hypothetical protein